MGASWSALPHALEADQPTQDTTASPHTAAAAKGNLKPAQQHKADLHPKDTACLMSGMTAAAAIAAHTSAKQKEAYQPPLPQACLQDADPPTDATNLTAQQEAHQPAPQQDAGPPTDATNFTAQQQAHQPAPQQDADPPTDATNLTAQQEAHQPAPFQGADLPTDATNLTAQQEAHQPAPPQDADPSPDATNGTAQPETPRHQPAPPQDADPPTEATNVKAQQDAHQPAPELDADGPRYLPHDLLEQVLARLDSRSLANVAMASTWLRREAAAVRTSINSSNPCLSDTTPDSLLSYVSAHQQHLTSFRALFWYSSVQLSAALAALPNLSCLRLQPSNLPATFLQLLCMTSLKDLELRFDPHQAIEFSRSGTFPSCGLLPARLTALELRTTGASDFGCIPFRQGHPIGQLYYLRKLKLPRGANIDPDLLADWPCLQHLELQDVLQDVSWAPRPPVGAEAALLAQLQQQTQLTYLHLTLNGFNVPASSFAGLTASSSSLQHLHLEWRNIPQEGWEAMFPPGLRLPRLEKLVLQEVKGKHRLQNIPIPVHEPPGLNTAVLNRLADCCASSLRTLMLEWYEDRQPGCVGLGPVKHFTSLTSLSLNCAVLGSTSGLQEIYKNLEVLELTPPSRLLVHGGLWLHVSSTARLLVGWSAQEF